MRVMPISSSDWSRYWSTFLPDDWATTGRMAFRRPVGWLLNGLVAEPSSTGGSYVWSFIQPLFVPATTVVLSIGQRLGDGTTTFDLDDAADRERLGRLVQNDAIPWLDARSSPDRLLTHDDWRSDVNIRMVEIEGYSHLLTGNVDTASEVLRRVTVHEVRYEWEQQVVDRCAGIIDLIDGDVGAARGQLADWRLATAAAIGVADHLDPT